MPPLFPERPPVILIYEARGEDAAPDDPPAPGRPLQRWALVLAAIIIMGAAICFSLTS